MGAHVDSRPNDSSITGSSYRSLAPAKITLTATRLLARIEERFPDSGLARVVAELERVCREAETMSAWLARPNVPLRAAVGLAIFVLVGVVGAAFLTIPLRFGVESLSELLTALESGVNDAVFVAVAIWFLTGIEKRWKRHRALASLHTLRSLAHIVDMHQLTKDPERVTDPAENDTQSSPQRVLTPFELTRYLDYCSEALALTSKVAALHVQEFDDAETLAAVGEIEDLTNGLSRSIWQKITILDRITHPDSRDSR